MLTVCAPPEGRAESDPVYTSRWNNVAVGGYDVVSFYSGEPLPGTKDFKTDYKGAEWRFSTGANRDLFLTNPDAFAPQYGGYCAWAMANNELAKGSPDYWHIRDGKLYLNYNARIQEQWKQDIPGFILKADRNWPGILQD
ncbi:MAG: YHS domain-containing protein [Hyphomonadaceae bacterium]|nr:YHS domain-containing protein [Hyphomonadaceae bacterium]